MHQELLPSKMKIEIWSDIACPFCYLGKREFELALEKFSSKDEIQVVWRSFQLSPAIQTNTEISIYDHLLNEKGIAKDQARKMTAGISARGKSLGITYNFDQSVVSNTLKAHMLLHFAQKYGSQNSVKERLLELHFTEGSNVDDDNVLFKICEEFKMNAKEFEAILETKSLHDEVRKDIKQAKVFGISGVPFFVFDRKYAVSGAQENSVFQQTIQQAFEEWKLKSVE